MNYVLSSNGTTWTTQVSLLVWLYAACGALAGGCAAYAYHRLPARWLCDYEELPQERHAAHCRKLPLWAVAVMALLCAACTAGMARLFVLSDANATERVQDSAAFSAMGLFPLLCALLAACLVATLLLAALCDARYTILPDQLLVAAFALTLCLWAAGGLRGLHTAWYSPFAGMALGFFGLFGVMVLAAKVYKTEAMGFGDVKLLAVLGTLCGPRTLGVAVLLAVLSGGAILGTLLACGKITRRSMVPFGPFLVGGALAAVCLWPQWCALGAWYFRLFGL